MKFVDRTTGRRLLWLSVLGATPPVVFMGTSLLGIYVGDAVHPVDIYLWPTQLQMLAAGGYPPTHPWFWEVFAISLFCNVLLYIAIGFMLCWLFVDVLWMRLSRR